MDVVNGAHYRSDKDNKKKFNLILHKDNTVKSLKEVNTFLCSFNKLISYANIYNILK